MFTREWEITITSSDVRYGTQAYMLTAWSRANLEKLTVAQQVQNLLGTHKTLSSFCYILEPHKICPDTLALYTFLIL
jgi:hypothetical protein